MPDRAAQSEPQAPDFHDAFHGAAEVAGGTAVQERPKHGGVPFTPERARAIAAGRPRDGRGRLLRDPGKVARERQAGESLALAVRAAREDAVDFLTAVMRDEKDRPAELAAMHEYAVEWIEEQVARGERRLIWTGPFGHAKTTIALGWWSRWLARDTNRRLRIVHAADGEAAKRSEALGEILKSQALREVYPQVKPDLKLWRGDQKLLKRTSRSVDPSIVAMGVQAKGIGARADGMWFDDVDGPGSMMSDATREQTYTLVTNEHLSRLEPDGIVLITRTVWHEQDTGNRLAASGEYRHLLMRISEDLGSIEVLEDGAVKGHLPLWSETPDGPKWGHEQLAAKRREIGQGAFNRGFRQLPVSPEDLAFPHFRLCVEYDSDPAKVEIGLSTVGVDYSSKKRPGSVLTFLGLDAQGRRVPLLVRLLKDPNLVGKGLVDSAGHVARTWGRLPALANVENNGVQDALVDQVKTLGAAFGVPVQGYLTGAKQKWDPVDGMPALDLEFEQRRWRVCVPHSELEAQQGCACGYCKLVTEFELYPMGSTDVVMATWFAREAQVELMSTAFDDELIGGAVER